MNSQRTRILPPYTRRANDLRHLAMKASAVLLLLIYAMVMGFWLAVFGTLAVQFFVGVIGLLLITALWMAVDTEVDYRPQLTIIFLVFVGCLAVWPLYLAVDIPGLPWLTPTRIMLAALVFGMLLQMSQSSAARSDLVGALVAMKIPLGFYAIFWVFALGTSVLASSPATSFNYAFQFLLLWNLGFLAGIWVLIDPNALRRLVKLLLLCLAFVFLLTLLEYANRKPIWFDHIPSFLKVEGPLFEMYMQEQVRVGDGRYRARGNFAVHLFFAQYLLMIVPFMVHAGLSEKGGKRIAGWALALLALVICWMTNTRTALLGYVVVVSGTVALFALRRFLNPANRSDMVAPAIFMAVPAGVAGLLTLVMMSNRLQQMLLGGKQHSGSDDVRGNQWDRAISAVMNNPIGYGGNSSGPIAGRQASGVWIVDSTWINFLVDFGVIGTFGFAAMAGITIYYGVRIYLRDADDTANLCGPAAVGIGSFLLTMYTISFSGNFQMFLLLFAVIGATRYRLLKSGVLEQPGRAVALRVSSLAARA